MDTTSTIPPVVVDSRRDFIQTYKKELIIIGVLSGVIVMIILYALYLRFKAPRAQQAVPLPPPPRAQQAVPLPPPPRAQQAVPQVRAQIVSPPRVQQAVPQARAPQQTVPPPSRALQQAAVLPIKKQQKFPRLGRSKQINPNLPNISNQIPTGFSNQFKA